MKKRLCAVLLVLMVLSGCGSDAPQQQVEASVQDEIIVYVTDTGEKYHMEWCSYLISSHPMRLSSAQRSGYTPCSRCNPPR